MRYLIDSFRRAVTIVLKSREEELVTWENVQPVFEENVVMWNTHPKLLTSAKMSVRITLFSNIIFFFISIPKTLQKLLFERFRSSDPNCCVIRVQHFYSNVIANPYSVQYIIGIRKSPHRHVEIEGFVIQTSTCSPCWQTLLKLGYAFQSSCVKLGSGFLSFEEIQVIWV